MIPSKLKTGDEIRVISPACSLAIISQAQRKIAQNQFQELGLKVSYSKNAEEKDEFDSLACTPKLGHHIPHNTVMV